VAGDSCLWAGCQQLHPEPRRRWKGRLHPVLLSEKGEAGDAPVVPERGLWRSRHTWQVSSFAHRGEQHRLDSEVSTLVP